nr:unnamed protein product [Callosobruchus analis]
MPFNRSSSLVPLINEEETDQSRGEPNAIIEDTKIQGRSNARGKDGYICEAALKLLLDNMTTANDVSSIFEKDVHLKESLTDKKCKEKCEFCNRKCCNNGKICCDRKKMQFYLIDQSIYKLSSISLSKENASYHVKEENKEKPTEKAKRFECNSLNFSTESLGSAEKLETLKRIQRRMRNMQKYYPEVYNNQTNIIEQYGGNGRLLNVKTELLDMDMTNSAVFWV